MMISWSWRILQQHPNVDIDVHAPTSVALTCMQGNESIEEQQGKEMVSKEYYVRGCT